MSVVHDSLQRSSGVVRTWYLKAVDGSVYGPVQLSVLCEWAAQSRIVPGNEISENAQTWMPVENLAELKLEWMAELPEGKTYGPFNVLAVPFLFNNGTLPADAKLINRSTGKTLQVREILKSSVPPDAKARVVVPDDKERKWEERYHEEKRTRLVNEAQLQQIVERLTGEAKATALALKEAQERSQRESAEYEKFQQHSRAAELQLKQVAEQSQDELRTVRAQLDNTERELAEQRKGIEAVSKQSVSWEEKQKDQVERLKRDLQRATTSVDTAKKDLADERRNLGDVKRQAQLREQELTRLIEEARQETDSRAGQLEKVSRELQVLEAGKGEALARAKEEEARQKARFEKQEKELQAAIRDLAEQKKRSQMLEKENAQRDARLQVQSVEFKKKTDGLTAELERLKKENESQRSLHAETEKSVTEREATLKREALFARSAVVKAEQELAAFKKQHETFKEESAQKEGELSHRAEQLLAQARQSAGEVERLARELAEKDGGDQAADKRAKDAEAEIGRLKTALAELQNRYDAARKESAARQEAIEKQLAGMESENRRLAGLLKQAGEKDEGLMRALDETRRIANTGTEELAETRKRFEDEATQLKRLLAEAQAAGDKSAGLLKQAHDQEAELRQALADQKLRSDTLEQALSDKDDELEARMAETAESRKESDAQRVRLAEMEKAVKDADDRTTALKQELADQKASYEAVLQQEGQQEGGLKKRCANLEEELRKKEKQLAETQRKLEKEQTLFSGIQAAESQKEKELTQQVQTLRERNEWIAEELREQQERYVRLTKENAATVQKSGEQAGLLEKTLHEVAAARDQAVQDLETAKVNLAQTRKQLQAALGTAAKADHELALETGLEATLRDEIRRGKDELDRRVKEMQSEAATLAATIKELEKQVAAKSDERLTAEKKAEAFAQELDRVQLDAQKLRQQHAALQDVVRNQGKTPVQRPQPLSDASGEGAMATYLRLATAAIVVIVCSLGAFQVGARRGKAAGVQAGLEMARVPPAESPAEPSPPGEKTPPPEEPEGIAWPKVSVDGVKVTAGDRECALVFESAVFSSRTVIAPEAAKALQSIAEQVRGSLADLELVIEGHTDSTPVGAATGNNYQLGLARANAVLDFLKAKGDLPAASMTATSKGEDDPPYSNDDEISRRKNRTVILRLVPKDKK